MLKVKGTKSIIKQSTQNDKDILSRVRNIKFWHQASDGDQIIDLSNLTTPSGVSNPTLAELTSLNLRQFEANLEIKSSQGYALMRPFAYTVLSNTQIKLTQPVVEQEVFEFTFHNQTLNSTLIGDVKTDGNSGILIEGQRDFNLGVEIDITDLNNQFPIQIYRGNTARLMLRNIGNADYLGDDSIGNYQMVDTGNGKAQVIRFNIPAIVGGETIAWKGNIGIVQQADSSVSQEVEKINGVVDKMRTDLLDVTGFSTTDPTRYDNGVATNLDLKAFCDKVFNLEKILNLDIFQGTDWIPYTPSTLTNTATGTGKWRRVGDTMEGFVDVTFTGTPTNEEFFLALPTGHSIDLNKTTSLTGYYDKLGEGTLIIHGNTGAYNLIANIRTATTLRAMVIPVSGSYTGLAFTNTVGTPVNIVAGDSFMLNYRVPIVGWTSTIKVKNLI